MSDTVPDFGIKKVESFCFHLHCIYKEKTKQLFAILKKTRKFLQPANENFTSFSKKHVYESWGTLFPTLVLKKLKAFAFISILSIRARLNSSPLYLKTFKKFVQPANEKFTIFFKNYAYGSCRTLFPILVLKKLKTFAFICTVFIRARLNNGQL